MKNSFFARYNSATWEAPHAVSRERAAYLLRAARSRRAGNAKRLTAGLYRVGDANLSIFAA